MGYAISVQAASPIIEGLIRKGYIVRPWLGVSTTSVNQWFVLTQDLTATSGAFLIQVAANSPAAKAGLRVGDVITSLNGKSIKSDTDFLDTLLSCQVGQTIQIIYYRGNAKATTTATLIETPSPKK